MEDKELEIREINWINENGAKGGDVLGYDAETDEVLYRIVKENKNSFSLYDDVADDGESLGRFVTIDGAKREAEAIEEEAAEEAAEQAAAIEEAQAEWDALLKALVESRPCPCDECNPVPVPTEGQTVEPESKLAAFKRWITGGSK